ncbi:MAG: hypothetical protein ABIG95_02940 [Candidatus Woesearchaeota archaeon]
MVIKVKCTVCGQDWDANDFVLDPIYRKVVCSACAKKRRQRVANAKAEKIEVVPKKPAGWDAEDEYLDRVARVKQQEPVIDVEKVDSNKVRYTCPKCRYSFNYNIETHAPSKCPFCSREISKFRSV